MKYKGYETIIKYSDEDETFVGEVINSKDILIFDGQTVKEIKIAFHSVVDEYLQDCKELGRKPKKLFTGKFLLRIKPQSHEKLFINAKKSGKSLNAFIEEKIS